MKQAIPMARPKRLINVYAGFFRAFRDRINR
jgi:hypothetical protein